MFNALNVKQIVMQVDDVSATEVVLIPFPSRARVTAVRTIRVAALAAHADNHITGTFLNIGAAGTDTDAVAAGFNTDSDNDDDISYTALVPATHVVDTTYDIMEAGDVFQATFTVGGTITGDIAVVVEYVTE